MISPCMKVISWSMIRSCSPLTRQLGFSERRSAFWMIASNARMAKAAGTIASDMRYPAGHAAY